MTEQDIKTKLSSNYTSYEKVSWKRKDKNIKALITKLEPIQENILELMVEKNEILDKIAVIRAQMVLECVHPEDHLIIRGDATMYCKFCERSLGLFGQDVSDEEE